MGFLTVLFYLIAALILCSTAVAITRRNAVHAVLYLVISFFGTAMLFYLLGAPYLAALQLIVYAGAIMVLFLFVVMMMDVASSKRRFFPLRQWGAAAMLALVGGITGFLLLIRSPDAGKVLTAAQADPAEFSLHLFGSEWLSVEIASLLLLVALIGALVIAQKKAGQTVSLRRTDPSQ